MGNLTFGSLFAGIGGIDLGLERAGMRCEWQVEINDYATKVLEKHWPNVARFRDVCNVGKHNLTPVDLLCGGFPCQPHSQSGKRKASEDERDLWPEFARLIRELKPRWIVAENVLGLLSSENGEFFSGVLRDLARSGYDAQWRVFRASDFGFPHERRRVFIVAYADKNRRFRLDPYHAQGSARLYPATQAPTQMVLLRNLIAQLEQRWGTPSVCRADDGIPGWLDRLGAIGNSVVPEIVEHIGRCIVAAEAGCEVLA